jgi:predicted nucleic acid-binding protein
VILVDTSVWIDHLHESDAELVTHLESTEVVMHPMVVGELSLGTIRRRRELLSNLDSLARSPVASSDEVRHLIEGHHLFGKGLSVVDVHLLASARLDARIRLWTRDKRLAAVAQRLGVAHRPSV